MTIEPFLNFISSTIFQTTFIAVVIVLVSNRILKFLNNSSKKEKDTAFPSIYVKELKETVLKVEELEKSIEEDKVGKFDFTKEDKNLILKNIEEKLNQESNKEYLEQLELMIKKNLLKKFLMIKLNAQLIGLEMKKIAHF